MLWMSYQPREVLRHILVEADFLVGLRATLTRQALEYGREITTRAADGRMWVWVWRGHRGNGCTIPER